MELSAEEDKLVEDTAQDDSDGAQGWLEGESRQRRTGACVFLVGVEESHGRKEKPCLPRSV